MYMRPYAALFLEKEERTRAGPGGTIELLMAFRMEPSSLESITTEEFVLQQAQGSIKP